MNDKNKLKHLKRVELLEILVSLSEENDALKAEIADLRSRLNTRKIQISNAGSIAEAAMSINGVFEAAQAAASQYVDNIKKLSGGTELAAQKLMADTQMECEKMKREAQIAVDAKWAELLDRLESYCSMHNELSTVLPYITQKRLTQKRARNE